MKTWTHEVYAGKKTLGDVGLEGKRVFLRVDYNVPFKDGFILDNAKIAKSLATIDFLRRKKVSSIIIASHLGRPECDADPANSPADVSMLPVLDELNRCLMESEIPISFEFQYMVKEAVDSKKQWMFVQNLRSLKVEKDQTDEESKELFDEFVRLNCDLMVNDAFAVLHRSDYSVVGVPLEKIAGILLDSEMQSVSFLLGKTPPVERHSPMSCVDDREIEKFMSIGKNAKNFQIQDKKPIDLLIIGGCKLADKIQLVENLSTIASNIFLGGLLALPLLEKPLSKEVENLIESTIYERISVFFPADYVLKDQSVVSAKAAAQRMSEIKDIGPKTEELLADLISQSFSIFWNGTLGQAEIKEFAHGTDTALTCIKKRREKLHEESARTMICAGGGDTGGYINANGHRGSFDLIFTGGGATLAALQGDILPGVHALSDRKNV
ncbi:phosphoglycerate kinase [Nematocida minor]|uniref:phosphoglycerate kinase n=1 Tax=Nematocida minor TaxID=1912983 RepID=UPI00221FDF97|nr:phosphoglycerate kinase [Nematocida minor]KAI5191923.1 phosphoglycerate kinase [Nematocida minor]